MKKIFSRKLKWELAGILSLVVVLTVALNSLFSLWQTSQGFEIYVSGENRANAETIAPVLEKYYDFYGNWDGLKTLLDQQANYDKAYYDWTSGVDWLTVAVETIGIDEKKFYDEYDRTWYVAGIARKYGVDPEKIVQNIIDAEQRAVDKAVTDRILPAKTAEQNMVIAKAFAAAFVFSNDDNNIGELMNFVYTPDVVNVLLGTLVMGDQRIVVVSTSGFVVYDNLQDEEKNILGSHLDERSLEIGVPLYDKSSKKRIGTVIVGSFSGTYGPQQQIFLEKINQSFLMSGLLASIIGVLIGIWTSQRITAPVTALTESARRMVDGNQPMRLSVRSNDELGQMSQAFNKMIDALEEQQALRSRLLHDVAHELNTPLSVIQLELDAMNDKLQAPEDAAVHVLEEVVHLRNIINDLTWLSETNDGELQLESHPLDICAELQERVAYWQPVADAKSVSLVLDIAPELDAEAPFVQADEFRLAQVFRNLMDNALRYTPSGGTITVSLKRETLETPGEKKQYLVTRVEDSGIGIPQEDLPHIFERLYRVDPSRSREKGGHGLGLSIVKRIIEGYGGKVWAESTYLQGATIVFALPCYAREDTMGNTPKAEG